jgi:hypothetical protein
MPFYEFYSPDTNTVYTFFARGIIGSEIVPRCPDGEHYILQKQVSGFAVNGQAREPGESGAGDPEDPRMEAAMAELEREMTAMDEENPDPKQMGHLMRRMSEITGEAMPDVMEEMVGRLEAGEDPEKLEEQYGDMPELDDFGAEASGEDAGGQSRRAKALLRKLRGPVRDPQLYELSEYI